MCSLGGLLNFEDGVCGLLSFIWARPSLLHQPALWSFSPQERNCSAWNPSVSCLNISIHNYYILLMQGPFLWDVFLNLRSVSFPFTFQSVCVFIDSRCICWRQHTAVFFLFRFLVSSESLHVLTDEINTVRHYCDGGNILNLCSSEVCHAATRLASGQRNSPHSPDFLTLKSATNLSIMCD